MNVVEMLTGRSVMASKRFRVHSLLPTLNEYTRVSRGNKYASATMKKNAEELIAWEIRSQLKGWKTQKPVFLVFRWIEQNQRRDHDNVAFAKKFVQDALVKSGTIQGDGWRHVLGFIDLFYTNKNDPGVEVIIWEVSDERQGEAIAKPAKRL